MNAYAYTKQLVSNALAYIKKEARNYYKFGEGDYLPNAIIDDVNNSGTARECIDKLQAFIYGNGFADPDVAKSPANIDESFNKILLSLALNVSYSECVCGRVICDLNGVAQRFVPVPWQTLRRQGNNTFKYNPLMGYKDQRRDEDRWAQRYRPGELPAERLKRALKQIAEYGEQFGDILYVFNPGVGKNYGVYSIPKYFSGIEDIQSDALVTRLERRNLETSWQPQVIISTGAIDDVNIGVDGLTAMGRFDRAMKGFTGPDGKKIIHIEGNVNEGKPDVKVIDTASMLDQTDKATDRIGRKVCRHMGVPPVIAGFATTGQLGNNQELINTMELFKMIVIKRQDLIKEALHTVFPEKNFEISPLVIFNNLVTTK